MFIKIGSLLIAVSILTGCGAWAPMIVTTAGTTGAYLYYKGKTEEVYRVSMEMAYESAIRTMRDLSLGITEIKKGEYHRSIIAQGTKSKCKVTVGLESMTDNRYIKVSFRVLRHTVLPDRLHSRMIMKEFNNNLNEMQDKRLYQDKQKRWG